MKWMILILLLLTACQSPKLLPIQQPVETEKAVWLAMIEAEIESAEPPQLPTRYMCSSDYPEEAETAFNNRYIQWVADNLTDDTLHQARVSILQGNDTHYLALVQNYKCYNGSHDDPGIRVYLIDQSAETITQIGSMGWIPIGEERFDAMATWHANEWIIIANPRFSASSSFSMFNVWHVNLAGELVVYPIESDDLLYGFPTLNVVNDEIAVQGVRQEIGVSPAHYPCQLLPDLNAHVRQEHHDQFVLQDNAYTQTASKPEMVLVIDNQIVDSWEPYCTK